MNHKNNNLKNNWNNTNNKPIKQENIIIQKVFQKLD